MWVCKSLWWILTINADLNRQQLPWRKSSSFTSWNAAVRFSHWIYHQYGLSSARTARSSLLLKPLAAQRRFAQSNRTCLQAIQTQRDATILVEQVMIADITKASLWMIFQDQLYELCEGMRRFKDCNKIPSKFPQTMESLSKQTFHCIHQTIYWRKKRQ